MSTRTERFCMAFGAGLTCAVLAVLPFILS